MKAITVFLFLSCAGLAQKTTKLQIATWPSHAEVSLDQPPQAELLLPMETPAVVQISLDSPTVKLYFFKPGYQDTALTVRLKPGKDNFFFLHLLPEQDSSALDEHSAFLRERAMHVWGRRTMWASLAPLVASGLFALQAIYYYDQAKMERDQTGFPDQEQYRNDVAKYRAKVRDGDQAKTRAAVSLGIAGVAFLVGATLSF